LSEKDVAQEIQDFIEDDKSDDFDNFDVNIDKDKTSPEKQ
jgi:hypothetical protein